MKTNFSIVTVLNEDGNPIKIACLSNLPNSANPKELTQGQVKSNPSDNSEGNPSAE